MNKFFPTPKLRVIHSGLILVSVPLIFGLITTLVANSALKQSVQTRKSLERSAVSAAAINKLVIDSLRYKNDLNTRDTLAGQERIDKLNLDIAEINDDYRDLNHIAGRNDTYRQELLEVMPVARDLVGSAEETRPLVSESKRVDSKKGSFQTVLLKRFNNSIESLMDAANRQAKFISNASLIAKEPTDITPRNLALLFEINSVQHILAWLITANIVMCPILVLFFSQRVVRRLSILTTNAERFAKDEELLEPIDGDDEIAQLDQVFRKMAYKIKSARTEREDIERLKKELVAMIGHDLRTPLNAVQGTLSLIADGVYGDISDSGVNKAKVAEQSLERLTNLANELIDIEKFESKKVPLQLGKIQLKSVFEESICSLEGFAVYKQIKIEVADTALEVIADGPRLVQVIVNLLSNAIKFSNDGSTVSISARETDSGSVEIRVTDNGRGIPRDKQSEIFERYKQVDKADEENQRGLGLGLAICKAIVESHGGAIGVDSEDGKGCSFWFTLTPVQQKIRIVEKQEVV